MNVFAKTKKKKMCIAVRLLLNFELKGADQFEPSMQRMIENNFRTKQNHSNAIFKKCFHTDYRKKKRLKAFAKRYEHCDSTKKQQQQMPLR